MAALKPTSAERRKYRANALRALSIDAVEKARSGHPGAPLGMADFAEVLWNDFLRHNPANPSWPNRDRFVLSNGHASMLLYALLHLSGYELPLDEIRRFRQLGSLTPGHPEYGLTPGVETTTGPLGQGFANAVGMAIAERTLAARFNRPDFPVIDHCTYVSVGDGCLMEGLSHEAASLAGVLKLGKLITLFDSNGISIDGATSGWFTENVAERFRAYGWHVIDDIDGHDAEQILAALTAAQAEKERPTLIALRTIIGYGAPTKQGTAGSHGAPLGADEAEQTKKALGWKQAPFIIPADLADEWNARERGARLEAAWCALFEDYRQHYPAQATELERQLSGELPEAWAGQAERFLTETAGHQEKIATRKASQRCLSAYAGILPELIGGSADLTESNLTWHEHSRRLQADEPSGNYLYYGVREFGMAAINNGLALHGGFIPYGGTFLVFSDYARNAIRMAALMRLRHIFVFTHDSIGLGEDGPTHQPVEHASALRLIPGLSVWRPCDELECAVAWCTALERRDGPSALLLSRQGLPAMNNGMEDRASAIRRGGYVLSDDADPELILIATGSEVAVAAAAAETLRREDHRRVRVVSMPSTDVYEQQDKAYRDSVLPETCRQRIAIEAGVGDLWHRYTGDHGRILSVDRFGESAPGSEVYNHLGINEEQLLALCKTMRLRRINR